jgi:hypothetical protein
MDINYKNFLPHYDGKVWVGLLVMRQRILLSLGERSNVHLLQGLVMYTMRNKHYLFERNETMET